MIDFHKSSHYPLYEITMGQGLRAALKAFFGARDSFRLFSGTGVMRRGRKEKGGPREEYLSLHVRVARFSFHACILDRRYGPGLL
ncbi:hypothetical protein SCFA_100011 [anaerobic digester metagenome]|uniref:Uncharacterized protein n=1 Tax=anaerobic digester metagenome TaxID=1263854 RepID=A0A485LTQ2_9ZZZZ